MEHLGTLGEAGPFIKDLQDVQIVCEVGCHRLESTVGLRELYPHATIYAFEPNPVNVKYIQDNGLVEKLGVNFYPMAVCDAPGTRDFWLSFTSASSSLRRPVDAAFHGPGVPTFDEHPIKVDCMTLDSLHLPAIDLLWMDVQSGEDMVLQGAVETLPHVRYIWTEHNTSGVHTNEPGLAGIKRHLPGWELVASLSYDAFFRNPNFTRR